MLLDGNKGFQMEVKLMSSLERATFTVPETAKYLGVGITTTYALVKEKTIPAIKIGRQIRIPRVALDEWLLKQACL